MPKNTKNHKNQLHVAQQMEEQTADDQENSYDENKKPLNFTPKSILQTPQQLALYDKAVFTWVAPEYVQHPKTKRWYMIAAILAGVLILYDFFTANLTMAVAVIVLGAVYYYLHNNHPPKDIKITLSRMGIKVGNMIFPYSAIQAFWIIYNPHVKTLNLRVKEHFFSDVVIQLNQEDPVPVREFLCGQIPEWEGKNETFSEVVLRLLKL